jgi:vacuolar-type H+-ATPase subunit E/Vma4
LLNQANEILASQTTNLEVALRMYDEELSRIKSSMQNYQISRSISKAVQSDDIVFMTEENRMSDD